MKPFLQENRRCDSVNLKNAECFLSSCLLITRQNYFNIDKNRNNPMMNLISEDGRILGFSFKFVLHSV